MNRTRVLLADNDHSTRCRICWMLEQHGFVLLPVVADGRSLIDIAERQRPDVIVTDVSLWGMSGIGAIAELKRNGCPAKIVLTTPHHSEVFAAKCRAAGVGYVLKSRLQSDLLTAVNEVTRGQTPVTKENVPKLAA